MPGIKPRLSSPEPVAMTTERSRPLRWDLHRRTTRWIVRRKGRGVVASIGQHNPTWNTVLASGLRTVQKQGCYIHSREIRACNRTQVKCVPYIILPRVMYKGYLLHNIGGSSFVTRGDASLPESAVVVAESYLFALPGPRVIVVFRHCSAQLQP
jgi:hypothetical protein